MRDQKENYLMLNKFHILMVFVDEKFDVKYDMISLIKIIKIWCTLRRFLFYYV